MSDKSESLFDPEFEPTDEQWRQVAEKLCL